MFDVRVTDGAVRWCWNRGERRRQSAWSRWSLGRCTDPSALLKKRRSNEATREAKLAAAAEARKVSRTIEIPARTRTRVWWRYGRGRRRCGGRQPGRNWEEGWRARSWDQTFNDERPTLSDSSASSHERCCL